MFDPSTSGAAFRLSQELAHNMFPGPSGPDSDLRQYGLRLAREETFKSEEGAVFAVARKLAVFAPHALEIP